MIKQSLKNLVVLSLSIWTLSSSAHNNTASKDLLVQQCRDLSENIVSLVSSQDKKSCVEKLAVASYQIEIAGDLIIGDDFMSAKKELEDAVYALWYAELNNCNRYIEISHSKFEAQRIRNSLQKA